MIIYRNNAYWSMKSPERPKKWAVATCGYINGQTLDLGGKTCYCIKDGFRTKKEANEYIFDVICADVFPWRKQIL